MNIRKYLVRVLMAALIPASGMLSSCSLINEDLEECNQGVRLRFVYDYNMEFANAFPSQVDCLTLLIYDKDGNFVGSRTAAAPEISDENYRMNIDLPEGEYHFVAYGGMECDKSSFHFTDDASRSFPSKLENLEVAMNQDCITSPKGTELHKLFYGNLDVAVPADALDYTSATLYMMRDTNEIKVLLQQINGEPVDDSAFTYTITADNTLFNYKNDLVPVGSTTFYPWTRGEIEIGENQFGDPTSVASAQFALSRLTMTDNITLTINLNKDGREVVRIPLIKYLIALRNEEYAYMGKQEYLDRENYWDLIFLLDSNYRWVKVSIIVNGSPVRVNDIEFN